MPDVPTTAAEVKEVIADVLKPPGFTGEFELGDGSKIKASSFEEAIQILDKRRMDTVAALRDREEQIRQRDAQLAERQPGNQPTPDATSGFDQKHYWELMNVDVPAAQKYVDAFRFGVKPEQVDSLYQEVFNTTQYSADKKEVEDFMQSNPDFPGTKEATDKIWNIMAQENFPITARNIEYVYLRAVRDGEIEPLQEEAPQPWVPPHLQGGGTQRQRDDIGDPFANVPDDKLDEAARRLGLMK